MNIVQVTSSLETKIGGPPRVTVAINKILSHDHNLMTLVFGKNDLLKTNVLAGKAIFGNRYGLVISPFLKISRDQILNSTVVIAHGYYLFSTLFAIFMNQNPKTYIMPHGSLETYQENYHRFRKTIYNNVVKLFSRKKNIHWLVASESEMFSVKAKFPDATIDVVGLGIEVDEISKYEFTSYRPQGINLFTYSRIAEKKRIDVCIHLVGLLSKHISNLHLDIVGEGKKSLVESLKSQTEILNLANKVTFHGHVESISDIKFTFDSPIFLLTSENENFAIAVCEAIASGIPVIVTKEVAMKVFVESHNVGVVIDDISLPEIASAVEIVMKNYANLRKNCILNAYLLDWSQVMLSWKRVLSI